MSTLNHDRRSNVEAHKRELDFYISFLSNLPKSDTGDEDAENGVIGWVVYSNKNMPIVSFLRFRETM